jgi:hypothetical protein
MFFGTISLYMVSLIQKLTLSGAFFPVLEIGAFGCVFNWASD